MAGRNTELKPYCSMPVIIGENVTVTTVCEHLDKFFLSPFNLPDDVSDNQSVDGIRFGSLTAVSLLLVNPSGPKQLLLIAVTRSND